MNDSMFLSKVEKARLRRECLPFEGICEACGEEWPCTVTRLLNENDAIERERDTYRSILDHNHMIVRGGPQAVLEDHRQAREKTKGWDKLDDELCALCALANMVIDAERERDDLRNENAALIRELTRIRKEKQR